jgi:hypothetical protein
MFEEAGRSAFFFAMRINIIPANHLRQSASVPQPRRSFRFPSRNTPKTVRYAPSLSNQGNRKLIILTAGGKGQGYARRDVYDQPRRERCDSHLQYVLSHRARQRVH